MTNFLKVTQSVGCDNWPDSWFNSPLAAMRLQSDSAKLAFYIEVGKLHYLVSMSFLIKRSKTIRYLHDLELKTTIQ